MEKVVEGVATFGFGAVMAVLIFVAYERLVREVISVVQANTRAIEELSFVINGLRDQVIELNRRVGVLEVQGNVRGKGSRAHAQTAG
jgi:hypothetical protein